ncbi:MAG: glycosyltransferase family 39 protein [Bdellovibrionales bacterium]
MKKAKHSKQDIDTPLSPDNGVLLYAGIFILAFVMRVIFVSQWEGLPYGKAPLLDAASYDAWAKAIADGNWLRATAFYQSPLYPYLLGLIYKMVGHDTLMAGLVNALLSAGGITLISAVSRKSFGTAAALITGLLGAFYQPLVFYAVPLMKEALLFFLLAAFLFFAVRAFDNNRMRDYLLGGLFLGLAVIARGNALFLLPVFYLIAFIRFKRKAIINSLLSLVLFILCLLPVTIHNYVVSDDFVPVNYADGFNLYVGNWANADGTSSYPPEVSTNPVQEEIDTTLIARDRARLQGPEAVSRYWRDRAFTYMKEHPFDTLKLAKNKFVAFWSNQEAFDNHNTNFIRENFDTALKVTYPWFGVVSVLAAFAAFAEGGRKRRYVVVLSAMLLAYMASLMLFYVTERYRFPAVAFLLPLAGAALPAAGRLYREKAYVRLSCSLGAAVCFLILALQPIPSRSISPPAFNWGLLTSMYADTGDYKKAVVAMNKALALSQIDAGFLPIVRGAEAEERLGNKAESERLLNMATELFPKASGAWYYLGLMKEKKGNLDGALKAYRKAAETGSRYTNSYVAMARVYWNLGKPAKSEDMLKYALKLAPYDIEIAKMLMEIQSSRRR